MNMAESLQFQAARRAARTSRWRGTSAGAPAARPTAFFAPADLADLCVVPRARCPRGEPVLFVGLGSNLLVRDGGFRGTVVFMHSAALRPALRRRRCVLRRAPASPRPKVARFAAMHSCAGAEFLAGIPGTVGGALAMNAGCYGGETWDVVERGATIDRTGSAARRARQSEFEIGYRHCQFRPAARNGSSARCFRLPAGDGDASRARIKELLAQAHRHAAARRSPTPAACSATRRATTPRA